jgi:futalosine hydrolase
VNILLLTATRIEIAPLLRMASLPEHVQFPTTLHFGSNKVDVVLSSPGIAACTYHLTKYLQNNDCDLAINVGIAGAFDKGIPIGQVVEIKEDTFGDLGIDNRGVFHTFFEEQLLLPDQFPYQNGWLHSLHTPGLNSGFPMKRGVTVNTASGSEIRIHTLVNKFHPDIETMEGAAFFYTCLLEGISFIALRSVSNYVEERNKSSWNIPLAVENLNDELLKFLDRIK